MVCLNLMAVLPVDVVVEGVSCEVKSTFLHDTLEVIFEIKSVWCTIIKTNSCSCGTNNELVLMEEAPFTLDAVLLNIIEDYLIANFINRNPCCNIILQFLQAVAHE
jgi:hypothetical protein